MTDILRQEIAATADTVVVKVGTRVVTKRGVLDEDQICRITTEIHDLIEAGRRVVLVSSGAVGAGMTQLNMTDRPTDLAKLQAVAAVGQSKLTEAYDRHLRKFGRHAAQVLLTADELDNRSRYLNVRNTLLALLEMGSVPIINENDTVSVEELKTTFGDNDRLAAVVTNLLRAPLLILLSDVDGLYDGNPDDVDSKLISTVTELNEEVLGFVQENKADLSKGGMASKLEAARITTTAGENVIIASGRRPGVIAAIMEGKSVGTLFVAQGKSISPWKRWIGFSAQPRGHVVLDDGATRAVSDNGRSLLAIGIVSAHGNFQMGDVVILRDRHGNEIARGLSNYPSTEVSKIVGRQSGQIAKILGYCPYEEVMHRDNIAVTR